MEIAARSRARALNTVPSPFKGFVQVQILPRNRSRPWPVLTGFFHSSRTVLDVGRKRQSCFNKPREDARADWKDVVVEYEVGVVDRCRPLVPEPEIGPGLRLQHVCEILTAGLRARRRRHVLALASSAVPLACFAKAVGENARTTADAVAIVSVRNMAFLLGWRRVAEISNRNSPDDSLTEGETVAMTQL
jgi:hypothetical protein